MPDSPDNLAAALTAGMAAGDEAAVEAFYRRYFDRLYGMARRATRRDEAFCLDVVQEAVLLVIRLVRPVDTEARLVAWLRLVVRTTAYDLLRGDRRRRRREVLAAVGGGRSTSNAAGDEPAADAAQLEWLRGQIGRLDPQLVRIIDLCYRHEWTLARIAAALGVSTGTIDGRLRRALAAIRRNAPADWEDEEVGSRR